MTPTTFRLPFNTLLPGSWYTLKKGINLFIVLVGTCSSLYGQISAPACGTKDSAMQPHLERYFREIAKLSGARASFGETLVYRLAVDINYNTYLLYNKDKLQITKVLHEFVEKASAVYERDVNIKLVISDVLIWDHPEPYQLKDDYDYYNNVVNYWETQRPGDRDCIVSFSSRSGWFYGGGRMCTSNFPSPNTTLLEVDLLCHELGHTLGSPHTHWCYWPGGPIDVCTTTEGVGESDCTAAGSYTENVAGSIMSYCRAVLEFHPLCSKLMRDYAEGNGIGGAGFVMQGVTPAETVKLVLNADTYSESSPVPAFQWRSTFRSEAFRFQLSSDPAFLSITSDTLLHQPFYHAEHFTKNTYYVRVRAESSGKTGPWSNTVRFDMPGHSDYRPAPLLIDPIMFSNGKVRTAYINNQQAVEHEIQVIDPYNKTILFSQQGPTTSGGIQRFELNAPEQVYWSTSQIRLRVRYPEGWSKWSDFPMGLKRQWENKLFPTTPLDQVSGTPVLSFQITQGYAHLGLSQYLEVAHDERFSNVIFKDSAVFNRMGEYYSNKFLFNPSLEENSRYFVRTRLSNMPGQFSEWSAFPLQTQRNDLRFSFLGIIPKFSQAMGRSAQQPLTSVFYKSGELLYVYGNNFPGYYVTSDLKSWKEVSTHTTKGKLPNFSMAFAASPEREIYIFSPPNVLSRTTADDITHNFTVSGDINLYVQNKHAYITKNEGIFFIVPDKGIVQIRQTQVRFYQQELGSSQAVALAADRNDRLWALMQGGGVYVFNNGTWAFHSSFPYWNAAKHFCFDYNNTPYVYGDFGVARLNQQTWQNIAAVKGYPIKKAVFDDKNQLWMASYQGTWSEDFTSYALLKLKEDQLTSYTDGLNFLKEVFDLEYFKNQLLIMTTGGEVHAFDETQIQRFQPAGNFCQGDELKVTITSNSSFRDTNRFRLELVNTQTTQSVSLEPILDGKDILSARIPLELAEGTYRLRTQTTDPEITSNESGPFLIASLPKPVVQSEAMDIFRQRLSTVLHEGYSYQWLLEGKPITGRIQNTLEATRAGNYSVEVTNKNGCSGTSETIQVVIPDPTKLTLLQNVPNPFSDLTTIAFYLPVSLQARLEIFDHHGRRVALLKEGVLDRGWHETVVRGEGMSAGLYVYRLTTSQGTRSLRLIKR